MLTYHQAIDYLFGQRPAFERQGANGYKPGLETTTKLAQLYANPHNNFKVIHVAGTNGKGSVSSMIAAVLQAQGYTTGLYTSPHFVDFSERIKVNGIPIPHDRVVRFVDDYKQKEALGIEPSFFELSTILAFKHFDECEVDYAVVEVGLGGRLDSTNIVDPELCVITNISVDHTEFLGNTIAEIAAEKAGIIKSGTTVIVGEVEDSARQVIKDKACEVGAYVRFVQDADIIEAFTHDCECSTIKTKEHGSLTCQLVGEYQRSNIATALAAIGQLSSSGIVIDHDAIKLGLAHVCDITSLRGRWTIVRREPLVVCDSAHNVAGIKAAMHQLGNHHFATLHMVVGFMADKDLEHILPLLPTHATYYFAQANSPRSLNATTLATMAHSYGLNGKSYSTVVDAYKTAMIRAQHNDLVFVGGSMYVLAEFFSHIDSTQQQ